MTPKLTFQGPLRYRLRTAAAFSSAAAFVSARRAAKGPKLPGWNFAFEFSTRLLKNKLQAAFKMDIAAARQYLDAAVIESPSRSQIVETDFQNQTVRGTWFTPRIGTPRTTLLYFHGGGYSFYPKTAYASFIAQITLASQCKTFALDYRLAPEYKYPAQLQDAFAAYRWLLDQRTNPEHLVIAGDSAGGNLAIALLLSARSAGLPLPSLAVGLSPAIEFDRIRPSIVDNEEFDWLDIRMLARFASWFCNPELLSDPLVSPIHADLRNLPPIYIQAGRREVMFDSIVAFSEHAKAQKANVTLDLWDDMNHCFQCFADYAPQSHDALTRIGSLIQQHTTALSEHKI
jgi:monoterpene epsilon-lactone hydrolase